MKSLIKLAGTTLLILALFFSGLIAVDLVRIFAFFYRIHPALAAGLFSGLAIFIAISVIILRRNWLAVPRRLMPPAIPDLDEATPRQIKTYLHYLSAYLRQLSWNSNLPDEARAEARRGSEQCLNAAKEKLELNEQARRVEAIEEQTIEPILTLLDEQAAQVVREFAQNLMEGVSLSPIRGMDTSSFVTHNLSMVRKVVRLYRGKPGMTESIFISGDVYRVIRALPVERVCRKLVRNLRERTPENYRAAEDIALGIGAGWATWLIGRAAMHRTTAYPGWDPSEAHDTLLAEARLKLETVRDLYISQVLPHFPFPEQGGDEAAPEPTPETIIAAVQSAFAELPVSKTEVDINDLITSDAPAAVMDEVPADVESDTVRRTKPRKKNRPRKGVARVVHTFGQRMKYTRFRMNQPS